MTNIHYIKGDITKLEVDCIVNSANKSLLHGSGVCGAIHKASGIELEKECLEIKKELYPSGLPTGEAIITKGYNLPCKYVIHTVGPVYKDGNSNEEQLLSNCYLNSLLLAQKNNIKSIAFPAISTGIYGYPKDQADNVVKNVLNEYIKKDSPITDIYIVEYN